MACTHEQLRVSNGPWFEGGTGEYGANWTIRNVGHRACTLWGWPQVRLLDADNRAMPFRYAHLHGSLIPKQPRPVVVPDGGRAFMMASKYRCDVTRSPPYSRTARIRLPEVPGSYLAPATSFPLCGPGDPPQVVYVRAAAPSLRAFWSPPPPMPAVAAPIGASFMRSELATYGLADPTATGAATSSYFARTDG